MAIQHRPDRKSPWRAYWRNPFTGRIESESYDTEHDAKKADSLIKHRLKFDRDSFRKDESDTQTLASPTFAQAYALYLKEKQFSKKSLAWSLGAMHPCLTVVGIMPVTSITRKDLDSLKSHLLSASVKPVTVRGQLSVLRTLLRWCAEKGIIEQTPQFPKLPPAHYERFIPPTPNELASLMAVAPEHVQRVLVLGSQLGIRVGPSELLRLTWSDVDISRRIIRVQASKKRPDQPWREVPIRESLLPFIQSWADADSQSGSSHVINYKGNPIDSVKRSWATMLKAAGINRKIRPYDLRHAFATEAIAAGVDVGTVAQLMGHSSPTMLLKHYQHVADAQKRNAVESLPDIPCMPKFVCPKNKALRNKS